MHGFRVTNISYNYLACQLMHVTDVYSASHKIDYRIDSLSHRQFLPLMQRQTSKKVIKLVWSQL